MGYMGWLRQAQLSGLLVAHTAAQEARSIPRKQQQNRRTVLPVEHFLEPFLLRMMPV